MKASQLEKVFQSDLIKDLKDLFPGCVVLVNDPNYIQGFPDLLVLHKKRWAALECKAAPNSSHQPNQDYYVDYLDDLSYATFVFPENKEDVLHALQLALGTGRPTRVSQR